MLQAELLLRYVSLLEASLPPEIGESMFNAVVEVTRATHQLTDEHQRRHISGRPEIHVSDEHLALLFCSTTSLLAGAHELISVDMYCPLLVQPLP